MDPRGNSVEVVECGLFVHRHDAMVGGEGREMDRVGNSGTRPSASVHTPSRSASYHNNQRVSRSNTTGTA